MFLISMIKDEPRLDTMPVFKTTEYPWSKDSFRPLCYCRAAALSERGLLFDLQVFERDPIIHESSDLLDDSCAAISFRFFPEKSDRLFTVVLNAAKEYRVFLNGEPFEAELSVDSYGGVDEQGWYWGVRFILPQNLLDSICGVHEFTDGHLMLGNIYKFKRTGSRAHIGAVAPMKDDFIFSVNNLAEFRTVDY